MVETLRLSPVISTYPDDKYENLLIEVLLPGVEKKDVSFKLTSDSFYVSGKKEGVSYLDSYPTDCPVVPEKAVAKYSNGVLKVTVPYQEPLEKLVDVKIE
ncbi:Hsp20/alpha crystallin family protein [Methanosarcina sp.]|uniref:Hsp20/alpha crystallin family protein n=1 Tax=Methanosarcina sp. TaxID=2213 RepID=UPI00298854C5|nr:Hsp20/alpha crystallin family protein [Methanosarcina sp.]MDW5551153.1 Hsp20/alpha crystallin family protein [Methanosarcina sp.]MDW5552816.1 Hsp20/alpha crystallin family protein [Methanosarcina sp.]MDW5558169.1 Hsp20/alpha crystallin family protein [Methanosarcina sp.]